MSDNLQVLLVEDNPGDVKLLEAHLEDIPNQRYSLTAVGTLGEAIGRLKDSRFDLVLLDLSLPDSVGQDTLQKAHAASPMTPIVVADGAGGPGRGLSGHPPRGPGLPEQEGDHPPPAGPGHPLFD